MRASLSGLALAACGLVISPWVQAQSFPTKPITLIVPFSPGTTTDVNAREFGQVLSALVKQPVVIDNKVGAEGGLGAQALLNAPADGHTIMFTSNSLTVLDPLMKKNMPYDPLKDFASVCTFARTSNVMNITGSSRFKTVSELVAAGKADPGKLTFAYASTVQRLAGELFQQAAGVKMTAVPYRSSLQALTDVGGGQVDMIFIDHISATPLYQSGKVRPLTLAGSQRLKALPDVPAASEAGVPGYQIQVWFGFYASSKTPPAVLNQLREVMAQALRSPAAQTNMEKRDLIPLVLCGDAQTRLWNEDLGLMRQVVQRAGIQPE